VVRDGIAAPLRRAVRPSPVTSSAQTARAGSGGDNCPDRKRAVEGDLGQGTGHEIRGCGHPAAVGSRRQTSRALSFANIREAAISFGLGVLARGARNAAMPPNPALRHLGL